MNFLRVIFRMVHSVVIVIEVHSTLLVLYNASSKCVTYILHARIYLKYACYLSMTEESI